MKTPRWFIFLIVVVALASLYFSMSAATVMADAGLIDSSATGWLYPAYVVISSVCSGVCYPSRRGLAWILLGLMVLTDIGLLTIGVRS